MIMLARRAKPFDPRSKGNVSEGREALRGLPWPIVAPIVAQTALQPEVAATSLPCLVTQCLAALHNAQANCTACNTAVTRPRVRRNVTSYTAARKPPPSPPHRFSPLDTKDESCILVRVLASTENSISQWRAPICRAKLLPPDPCVQGVCNEKNSSVWIIYKLTHSRQVGQVKLLLNCNVFI